ncbi:MAG TPA: DUF5996 family protein [Acidimicrobiales bacterium]|nr:DUF5996 family protein [Acidimicrobiales bacterium]
MTADPWPSLPVAEWEATRDTLQLWTQVIGKLRLACSPLLNHWWNVTLYVTARGLTTSLMWADDGRGFQIDFDFVAHRLDITVSDGSRRSVALEPRSVADFYGEVIGRLDELDIHPEIWTMPVEIEGAIPFEDDHSHASYDRDHVERFWQLLVRSSHVFNELGTTFVGKASPVHLFWGALDLATTRFSGRAAPPHPGGAPHCGPRVMREAYSQEVSSFGYWPGGTGEGAFYSYAYPEPDGYRDTPVTPTQAYYDGDLGEFLLPYTAVRTAADPRGTLLSFLQSAYAAAADRGGWDREALDRQPPSWAPGHVALPGHTVRDRPE